MSFWFVFAATIIGAWLGGSLSMDLSHHPAFPNASQAFVGFWTVFGGVVGFKLALKLLRYLDLPDF